MTDLFDLRETKLGFLGIDSEWCHWSHRLAQVGFRARRLIEVMRNFPYEMVLSNNRVADDDVNAAVDDARVQAIKKVKLKTTLPYTMLD